MVTPRNFGFGYDVIVRPSVRAFNLSCTRNVALLETMLFGGKLHVQRTARAKMLKTTKKQDHKLSIFQLRCRAVTRKEERATEEKKVSRQATLKRQVKESTRKQVEYQ